MEAAAMLGRSWRVAVRGNVLALGMVSLLNDFSSERIYPLLPAFVAGLAPGQAALVLGLMEGLAEMTASLLKLVAGRLSDRLGRRKILVVGGYALSSLCRPLMAVATAGWHAVGLRFGDRVGKGLRTSPRDALIGDSVPEAMRAMVADRVPPERRGEAYGVFHAAVGLAALPASLLFGVFWEALGPRTAFGIGAGLAAAAALLLGGLLHTPPSGRHSRPSSVGGAM